MAGRAGSAWVGLLWGFIVGRAATITLAALAAFLAISAAAEVVDYYPLTPNLPSSISTLPPTQRRAASRTTRCRLMGTL